MLATVSVVSRMLAFFVGASLVYISLFFTKGDDGRIQNWLVDLWVRIESASRENSRTVAFLQQTTLLLNKWLTNVFGGRLFSAHFVLVSAALSICSLFLFGIFRYNEHLAGRIFYGGMFFIAACIADEVIRRRSMIFSSVLVAADIALVFAPFWYWRRYYNLAFAWYLSEFIGIILGISLDIAFVAVIRAVLRQQEQRRELVNIIARIAINLILGIILIAPSIFYVKDNTPVVEFSQKHPNVAPALWSFVIGSATNLFAAFCAFSFVIVSLAALGHKVLWSTASRLIHVCYERRVIEKRFLLFSAGSALLSYSAHWFAWLQRLPR